jgi:hypothetical protein
VKQTTANRPFPAGNPVANLFVIAAGAIIIGISLVLGLVAFVVLGAIVAVLAAGLSIRFWWFNRKLARHARRPQAADGAKTHGIIEGEFRVVHEERDRDEHGDR